MAGQVILSIAYGIDVAPHGDRNVKTAENAVAAIIAGSLRGRIFDLFPFRMLHSSVPIVSILFYHFPSRKHALVVPWSWFQERSAIGMGTTCQGRTSRPL
jgi:hypothetical protein